MVVAITVMFSVKFFSVMVSCKLEPMRLINEAVPLYVGAMLEF
jgi:hypothetical protein